MLVLYPQDRLNSFGQLEYIQCLYMTERVCYNLNAVDVRLIAVCIHIMKMNLTRGGQVGINAPTLGMVHGPFRAGQSQVPRVHDLDDSPALLQYLTQPARAVLPAYTKLNKLRNQSGQPEATSHLEYADHRDYLKQKPVGSYIVIVPKQTRRENGAQDPLLEWLW